MSDLIPAERIENRIFLIRGLKVMVDRDLAKLYGVTTKRLNEQVKRNLARFPEDFMFNLSVSEKKTTGRKLRPVQCIKALRCDTLRFYRTRNCHAFFRP